MDGGGRLWSRELAGLTMQQIKQGLDQAIKAEWPPTLGAFNAACRGVMPMADVRIDIHRPAGKQARFTMLVLRYLDFYRYRRVDAWNQDKLLTRAWESARAHVMGGGGMPEYTPPARQVTHSRIPDNGLRMTAEEGLASVRAMLDKLRGRHGSP